MTLISIIIQSIVKVTYLSKWKYSYMKVKNGQSCTTVPYDKPESNIFWEKTFLTKTK